MHTGLGHPGAGQTSTELKHEGKSHRKREGAGMDDQAQGGSRLRDDENAEARALARDDTEVGPMTGHNVSLEGAEDQEPVTSEEVAAKRD